jgi:hypothetical protein
LHRHATLAGRLRGYLCQGKMAGNDLILSAIAWRQLIVRLESCPCYRHSRAVPR